MAKSPDFSPFSFFAREREKKLEPTHSAAANSKRDYAAHTASLLQAKKSLKCLRPYVKKREERTMVASIFFSA